MKSSFFSFILALFIFLLSPVVIFAKEVILGGDNIGIELRTPGLIVSGTYDIGNYNPSSTSDIQKGDIIVSVNKTKVSTIDEFAKVLGKQESNNINVSVELLRNEKLIERTMKVIREDASSPWKTGLFVKERILGTGTVTYYDPDSKTYGALGHKMTSSDNLVYSSDGKIYTSSVSGVKKSTNGKPGQKIASVNENDQIGDVLTNNEYGIYGFYTNPSKSTIIETATSEEVKLGKAYIYTVLDGSKIEKYEIEIIRAKNQNRVDTKGLTFKVTDEKLLNKTGGVVSGMSGSPIVQNGKLIGAVTHVVVDKVEYGHGIYIDWMLEQSEELSKNVNFAFSFV